MSENILNSPYGACFMYMRLWTLNLLINCSNIFHSPSDVLSAWNCPWWSPWRREQDYVPISNIKQKTVSKFSKTDGVFPGALTCNDNGQVCLPLWWRTCSPSTTFSKNRQCDKCSCEVLQPLLLHTFSGEDKWLLKSDQSSSCSLSLMWLVLTKKLRKSINDLKKSSSTILLTAK